MVVLSVCLVAAIGVFIYTLRKVPDEETFEKNEKKKILDNLHNGAIILLHSTSEDNMNVGCTVTFKLSCDTIYVTRYKW